MRVKGGFNILRALIVLALATSSLSSSAIRTNDGSQTSSAAEVQHVIVTSQEIASLPPGKSYLTKVGPGTLILSGSNTSNTGLSKVGTGTLILPNSSSSNSGGLSKVGSGVLRVYEFRSEQPIDFSRVEVQTGDSITYTGLEAWVRQHRPDGAMKGWPFKRLLIGPASGIAQVEGWKGGAKVDAPPGNLRSGQFYKCSGSADCARLALSDACASDMTCDGTGNRIKCYCVAK